MSSYDSSFIGKDIKISYGQNNIQAQDNFSLIKQTQFTQSTQQNIPTEQIINSAQKQILNIQQQSLNNPEITSSLSNIIENTTEQLNNYTSKEKFFSPILSELNIPITEQNINIASSLHKFRQPLNINNISYINSFVSKLQLKGESYIDAIVLLLTHGNEVNKGNVEAIKELSTGKNLFSSMQELSSIINSGKISKIITSLISNNDELAKQIKNVSNENNKTIIINEDTLVPTESKKDVKENIKTVSTNQEQEINSNQEIDDSNTTKLTETENKNITKEPQIIEKNINNITKQNKEVKTEDIQNLNTIIEDFEPLTQEKVENKTNIIKEFINSVDKNKFDVNISEKDNSLIIKDKTSKTEINLPIKSNISLDKPVFLEIENKLYLVNPESKNISKEIPLKTEQLNITKIETNIKENKLNILPISELAKNINISNLDNINNNLMFIINDKTPIKLLELDLSKIDDILSLIKPESTKIVLEGNKQFIQIETLNSNQTKIVPISKDLLKEITQNNINQPLQSDTKPNIISEQKVISQQPLESLNQPLQTDAKPNIIGSEPKVISQQPLETLNQPLQTDAKPNIIGSEPKIISQQPLETINQPLQTDTKPNIISSEPKVISHQPLETINQPLQSETKPNIISSEPKVISQKPLETLNQPLQTDTKPNIIGSEPKVISQQPLETLNQPLQTDTKPFVLAIDTKTKKINIIPLDLNEKVLPQKIVLDNNIFVQKIPNDVKQSIENIQVNKPTLFNFNGETVLINKTPDNKITFSPISKQENITLEKPLQITVENENFVAIPTKSNNLIFIPLLKLDNSIYKDLNNLAKVEINGETNILIRDSQTNKVSTLALEKNIFEPIKPNINIALAKTENGNHSIFINNESISTPKLIDLPKTINENYQNLSNPLKINIENKEQILFSDPKTNKLYNIEQKNIELDNFPKLEKNVFIKDNQTEGFVTLDKKNNTYSFINTSQNVLANKEIKEPLVANINNKENIVFTDDKNITKYTPLLDIQPKFIKNIDKPMIINYQNNDNLVLLDKRYNSLKLFSLDDNYFNQAQNLDKPIFSKVDNKNTLIINNDKINKTVSINIDSLPSRDVKTSEPLLVNIDGKQNIIIPDKAQPKIIPFDSEFLTKLVTIKNPIEVKIEGKIVLIVPDNQNEEHKIFDKKSSLPITKFDKFEQPIPIELNNKTAYLIKDPQDNKLKILNSKQDITNLGDDFSEPIKANINNKEFVIIPQNENIFKVPLNEITLKKSIVLDKPLETSINSQPYLLLPFKDNQTKLISLDLDFLKRGSFFEKSIIGKINDVSHLIINDEKHKQFKTIPFEQLEKKSLPLNDIKEVVINNNEYLLTPKENKKTYLIPKSDLQNFSQQHTDKLFSVVIDGKQNILIPDKNNNLKTIPIESVINNSKEVTTPIILDKTQNFLNIAIPSINNEQPKIFNIKTSDISSKESISNPFTLNVENEQMLVVPKENKLQSIIINKNNSSVIDNISSPLKINFKGNESLLIQNNNIPQIVNIADQSIKSFDMSKPVEIFVNGNPQIIFKDSNNIKLFSTGNIEQFQEIDFNNFSNIEQIKTARPKEISAISYSSHTDNLMKIIDEKNINPDQQLKINNINLNMLPNSLTNINKLIEKLLSVDILSDPQKFAQQIVLLKQVFGLMESELKILKQELDPYSQKSNNYDSSKLLGISQKVAKEFFEREISEENLKTKKQDSKSEKISLDALLNSVLSDLSSRVERISLNLQGRQLLSTNEKCFCIPLSIPFGELNFKGELIVREEEDNTSSSSGGKTLSITLSVETKNLDTVLIDFITFERDLQISIKVENQKIKQIFDEKINNLNELFKTSKYKIKPVVCSINPNKTRGNSILIPTNTFPKSLKRIDGVV